MWKKPEKTKEPESLEKAYDYAVFLLSLNLRTVGEMVRKMQQRGYSEGVIEKVIDRLKDNKYLDDQRYAEIFLENLKSYRNFGYYGIKKKMMLKRLPPELIDKLLQENFSQADELQIAKRLMKKEGVAVKSSDDEEESEVRYRAYGDADGSKEKSKLANRLKSRGFRGEVIAKLLF